MLKQLIKNTSFYTLSSLFSKGLGLLLLPVFTRLLTPEEYGVLDLLTAFAGVANVFVTLEISQGLARYWPSAGEHEREDYATTCLVFTLAVYSIFTCVSLVAAPFLSEIILGTRKWASLFYFAIPVIALSGLFYLFQTQFSYALRARTHAAVSMMNAAVATISSLLLLVMLEIGVKAIFIGQLAALVCACSLSSFLLRQSFSGSIDITKLQKMLRFSLPLVLSSAAFVLFLYVDRLIISRLLTLQDVGFFGIGQRVASVIILITAGLQIALTPLIYHFHEHPETPKRLAQVLRVAWGGLLTLALALGLFAGEIVTLIASHAFLGGAEAIFPLTLAAIFSNLYVFAPGLSLAEKTWSIAAINCAGLLLNALLGLLLTPALGIFGAATATAIASAVLLGAKLYFSHLHYPVPVYATRLVLALALCVGLFAINELTIVHTKSYLDAFALKILLLSAGALGMVAMLTSRKELGSVIQHLRNSVDTEART